MFKNMGENIPGENLLVGNFPGKIQKGGGGEELEVWKFFGRVFPNIVHFSFS